MKRHPAGAIVEGGYYWGLSRWEIALVEGEAGRLPVEGPGENFVRLPLPLVLVVAPLMGALHVMFLPLAGFVTLGRALSAKFSGKADAEAAPATTPPAAGSGSAPVTGKQSIVDG